MRIDLVRSFEMHKQRLLCREESGVGPAAISKQAAGDAKVVTYVMSSGLLSARNDNIVIPPHDDENARERQISPLMYLSIMM